MVDTSEVPGLIRSIVRGSFEFPQIMYVTKINYDDTLDLIQYHGKDSVSYEDVLVMRDIFSTGAVLNVNIDDRVLVIFVDGDKNLPIVTGVIQEGD
jgi:hypothetical protein